MAKDVRDAQIEDLKGQARECYEGTGRGLAHHQGKKGGVNYCTWLMAYTVAGNREIGEVICPYADLSVLVDGTSFRHPGCNFIKPEE
jgi:hypothetical protein